MARRPVRPGDASDVSQMSMFSAEEVPVRTGQWLAVVQDWLEAGVVSSSISQASLIRSLPVGFSSRTSLVFCLPAHVQAAHDAALRKKTRTTRPAPASSPVTGVGTSPSSSTNSPGSTPESPTGDGGAVGSVSDPSEPPYGACLTLDTSESPNEGVDWSSVRLTEILEPPGAVASKFFLSPTACQGILRRARKRGKSLPPALETALDSTASRTSLEPERCQMPTG